MVSGIELTASDALITDSGRGIARLDSKSQKLLGVISGEAVEIRCRSKSTAAIVWNAHPSDEGLGFIRIDGYIRQNIGAGIGDRVSVSKAEMKEAEKVTIAPQLNQRPPLSPDFAEYAKRNLEGRPVMRGDSIPIPMFGLTFQFVVIQVSPHRIVKITKDTTLVVKEEPVGELAPLLFSDYEKELGGYKDILGKLERIINLALINPRDIANLGVKPPHAVLLAGPAGVGKTLIAKAALSKIAKGHTIYFVDLQAIEIIGSHMGESERNLREAFRKATEKSDCCVMLVEQLDSITNYNSVMDQLAALLDRIPDGKLLVITETTNLKSINPSFLRPGRFDTVIEVPMPDVGIRLEILKVHTKRMPLDKDVDLLEIANATERLTGAGISKIVAEAGMNAALMGRRVVNREDFIKAMGSKRSDHEDKAKKA